MSWAGFWKWVDKDFNDVRPYSMLLFMGLLALPLLLAFAFGASTTIVEIARAVGLIGVMFVLVPYYIYRQVKNVSRRAKNLGQNKNG